MSTYIFFNAFVNVELKSIYWNMRKKDSQDVCLGSPSVKFNAWEERRVRLKVFNRDPIVVAIVQFNSRNGRSHGLPNVVLRAVKAAT